MRTPPPSICGISLNSAGTPTRLHRGRFSRDTHPLRCLLARLGIAREKTHELGRLQRVGTPLLGMSGWPSTCAVAFCSCNLAIVAPTDAAAEHAFDRHQAAPGQVWIR